MNCSMMFHESSAAETTSHCNIAILDTLQKIKFFAG